MFYMDILTIILVFAVGFIASFVCGLIGGGSGLIAIPALVFLGLPPHIAVATNRFGSLGTAITTSYEFVKTKKVVFRYVIPFIIITAIGSFIGARILIEINEAVLSKLIGIILLLMVPFTFLKSDIGLRRRNVSKYYKILGFLGFFGIAVYEGFLGAGAGIFIVYLFIFLFGLTYIEANATDKIPWLVNLIVSAIVFSIYGIINYVYGAILLVGMFIGGYLGAHTAVMKGNKFVKVIFSIVVVILAIKMLFF